MNNKPFTRIFGLDLLRCLAIVIVVLGHSSFLINNYTNFPFISLPDGVDLFFVLSGYLVGTILIKSAEQEQKFDFKIVLQFLKRRWFRTLPNYYLFLLINIILIYYGLTPGFLNKYLSTFFVFFQNFHKPYDFLFWESWSLCVEEWFYLTFPLVLLLLLKFTKYKIKNKHIVLITILFFLLFPLFYRMLHASPTIKLDLFVRKLVLTRLDTIGFGLAGAYIHWYYKSLWEKFKNIFFIIGLIAIVFIINTDMQRTFFFQTFYYSLIGLSILFILPKLESIKNENIPLKPFQFLSKISYSMYLLHLPLLHVMSYIFKPSNKTEALVMYMVFWVFNVLFSYLIYKIYEVPMMNLRDRKQNSIPLI